MGNLKEPTFSGIKYDDGKLQWHLLPLRYLRGIVRILMYGARKYDEFNWQKLENPKIRYKDALLRHFDLMQEGEIYDKESGLKHIDHIATNAIFLGWFIEKDLKGGS